LVHIIATDAHDTKRRPPLLGEGREAAARRVGDEEATHMVVTRPAGIIADRPTTELPPPLADNRPSKPPRRWLWNNPFKLSR
jgi:protein-tyrosine phosphatase